MIIIRFDRAELIRECQRKTPTRPDDFRDGVLVDECIRQVARRLLMLPSDFSGETIHLRVTDGTEMAFEGDVSHG